MPCRDLSRTPLRSVESRRRRTAVLPIAEIDPVRRVRGSAWRIVFALAIGLLCLGFSAVMQSSHADSHFTQSDAEALLREAGSDRKFAATLMKQARQWRTEAGRSRQAARESTTAERRRDWEQTAREQTSKAETLDAEAKGLIQRAEQREARAHKIEAALNARNEAEEQARQAREAEERRIREERQREEQKARDRWKLELDDVVGVWRFKQDDAPFVMVPEVPGLGAYAYKLEAHTRGRVWTGTYTPFEEGNPSRMQNARLVFRYKPKATEMNPEIPEWARRVIESELEWRIELNETGSEADPRLEMKWYPGEVRWWEGAQERDVEIIGDGEPRTFEIEPEYRIEIESLAQSALSIGLGGIHDPETYPIESLMKGQRFFVKVVLPPKLAEEQGTSLTVTFKNLNGEDETTLELTGTKVASAHRPVVYSHDEAVTIADCDIWTEPKRDPQILSLFWIFGVEGACLDLDVDSSDVVEVRFGKSLQQVIIYNSWVQAAIARHVQGAGRLSATFESVLKGGYKSEQKNAARKRLRMLKNYFAMMASNKLTDRHRFHVGELYFGDTGISAGIILMPDANIDTYWQNVRQFPDVTDSTFFNPLMQTYLEELSGKNLDPTAHTAVDDITWVSESEKKLVRKILRTTSKKLASNAIKTAAKNFSFGMYDGFVSSTGAGDFYLVVTGKDHFGRRQPVWVRLTAALGLASSTVLTITGAPSVQRFVQGRVRRQRLGKGVASKAMLIARAQHGVRKVDNFNDVADVPKSLSPGKRRKTALRLSEDPDGTGGPNCASRLKGERKPRTVLAPGSEDDLLEFIGRHEYGKSVYGDDMEFVDPFGDPVFEVQSPHLQNCNERAASYGYKKSTGKRVSQNDGHVRVMELMREEVQAAKRPASDLSTGAGILHGFDQGVIRKYLRSLGAKLAEVKWQQNVKIKLRHIWSALEKGWTAKVVIKIPNSGGARHAVIVDGLEVSASGSIVRVRVYDPNIGQIVRVSARKFNKLIDRGNTSYGALTLFRFDRAP